jgi:nucleoside 2-deoxyribosyltransferase
VLDTQNTAVKIVYVAGPLFTPLERSFNDRVAAILENRFSTYVPQRDGILIPGQPLDSASFDKLSRMVFATDAEAIRSCDVLLAILDGRCVDEGVAFELGYACALGKPCYGLRTDARTLLPWGNNPMIEKGLIRCFSSEAELASWVASEA